MVARAKDVEKNNELIAGANNTKLDMALGTKFRLRPMPCPEVLGLTSDVDEDGCEYADFVGKIRKKWEIHMYSNRHWIDSRGVHNLDGLLRLYGHQYLQRGEALATVYRRQAETDAPFRTVVQVLDTDRLRTPSGLNDNEELNGGLIVNEGVLSRWKSARPVGYYIHDLHPMDMRINSTGQEDRYDYVNKFSPFGRQQVVHSYSQKQPNMVRGIMQLATCLKKLRCMDRFTTATLETAILQSLIAFTIESDMPNAVGKILGSGKRADTDEGVIDCIKRYTQMRNGYRDAGNQIKLDGSVVPHLLSGESLKMHSASTPAQNQKQFFDTMFTYIARCCGMSKEFLTQDWSGTSFSSARAGLNVVYRTIEQLRIEAPMQLAQAIYSCWLEDCILAGEIILPNFPNPSDGWLYFVANRDALAMSVFKGPAKDDIDRAKTAARFLAEQKLGVYVVENYCDEVLQRDWEDIIEQQAIEEVRANKIRKRYGLEPLPAGMLHRSSMEAVELMNFLGQDNDEPPTRQKSSKSDPES